MNRRKLIGLIITNPEATYQQRVLSGVFEQCRKYGYDVAVFSPLVQACHIDKVYFKGEFNLFELVNTDLLDGLIIASLGLIEDEDFTMLDYWKKRLSANCRKPMVAIDLPFIEGCPVVYTDDSHAFSEITAHLLDVHECRNIYFLTGMKEYPVSERRLSGFVDEMNKRGLSVPDDHIFYGDFWYTGGEALADKIISGEIEMPDAVICASDHMALGLAQRLIDHGIKIPEQLVVTGYDATAEAVINDLSITSYIPNVGKAAAESVNVLRSLIEPAADVLAPAREKNSSIYIGESCGCPANTRYLKHIIQNSFYTTNLNYTGGESEQSNVGRLMESYMFENLAAATSPADCLERVCQLTYLFKPFGNFYLCLRDNWRNTDEKLTDGYPARMNLVMRAMPFGMSNYDASKVFCYDYSGRSFDTSLMLPQLFEEHDDPYVFYFVPIHFQDDTLGYAVLQNELRQPEKINLVFHNWIRNVNNALEMTRVQNELLSFSLRDPMTGLYNRRGMDMRLSEMREHSDIDRDSWLVFVIDMDGLKNINDNYGHAAGDIGINAVAKTARSVMKSGEICVRAGGDEFYIIGIGDYSGGEAEKRVEEFEEAMKRESASLNADFEVSASIGYCSAPASGSLSAENIIQLADSDMYQNKAAKKAQRR